MRNAAQDCGLRDGTLRFVRGEMGGYDIRINRALGDPETSIDCALKRLPADFADKYGLGPLTAQMPEELAD